MWSSCIIPWATYYSTGPTDGSLNNEHKKIIVLYSQQSRTIHFRLTNYTILCQYLFLHAYFYHFILILQTYFKHQHIVRGGKNFKKLHYNYETPFKHSYPNINPVICKISITLQKFCGETLESLYILNKEVERKRICNS